VRRIEEFRKMGVNARRVCQSFARRYGLRALLYTVSVTDCRHSIYNRRYGLRAPLFTQLFFMIVYKRRNLFDRQAGIERTFSVILTGSGK
jgi:hypothetical protein